MPHPFGATPKPTDAGQMPPKQQPTKPEQVDAVEDQDDNKPTPKRASRK